MIYIMKKCFILFKNGHIQNNWSNEPIRDPRRKTGLLGSRRWNWKFREKHFWNPNPELLSLSSYSFTEVRDSDFKNAFPGIFNFTVGILRSVRNSKNFHLGTDQKLEIFGPEKQIFGLIGPWIPVAYSNSGRLELVSDQTDSRREHFIEQILKHELQSIPEHRFRVAK